MRIEDALVKRIDELLTSHNVSISKVSLDAGMTPSTLYDVMSGRSKIVSVKTIARVCEGLDISLKEFFDNKIFDDIELE